MQFFRSSSDTPRPAQWCSGRFAVSLSPDSRSAFFYYIEDETVVVHGVYHSSRDPDKIRQFLESKFDEPSCIIPVMR